MGVELVIPLPGPCPLGPVLDRLAAAGRPCAVLMVDRQLWPPGRPLPEVWADVRLKTPAGMVTLATRADGIAVIAFGNASEELRAVQAAIGAALSGAG